MKLKNSTAEAFKENNMIFTSEGNFHSKKVQDDYGARPNRPAVVQTRSKWIIGDVTEVLDRNTWKLGKILKMLKNNYFVIRLADCIQLKEFHISSLRIPHTLEAPQSNPFPAADKATGRQRQPADCALPCSRAAQQMGSGGKKRKAAASASHHPSKRAHPRKVAVASLADSYLHSSSQAIEDAECSVASCSVNDPCRLDNGGNGSGRRRHGAGGLPDDAMSACPCTSGVLEEEEGAVDVHGLELAAYRSTMQALYASGPLTWEQEALLTNLRLSLNISNEEHLLQLRRLMSS
ncbi:hypothetical protein PAHAL_9G052000 [Panicum hallii]|uniref:ENT domain-containing protein n=1 Tax=Panicum hallii TaxID=206008 RepID=A0A2S3IHA5_9POAL|nr:uncharacterized protein LOC112876200 [Panicum hallii]XP_025796040.1 uncharacterized protein LOC112876200 [Panicum hallii]PAN44543.1 hypothetical protein PAHAL_9G052000 [Panicum hallii]PAN44544.1 hypothetical protein PAHAL_9G052000 [Panicum hallii]